MSEPTTDLDGSHTVKAVGKACRIIDAVHSMDGVGITELADRLNRSKGTIHRHLTTLIKTVHRQGGDDVPPQPPISGHRRGDQEQPPAVSDGEAGDQGPRDRDRHSVQISVEEFGVLVVLAIEHGDNTVTAQTRVGKRDHLHGVVSGKAILVHMPRDRIEEIIEHHVLPRRTPNTNADPGALFEELKTIRERGVSYNDEEEKIKGLRAVGAPILSESGDMIGSVSAFGPTSGFKSERFRDEIPEAVSNVANTIEIGIRAAENSASDIKY